MNVVGRESCTAAAAECRSGVDVAAAENKSESTHRCSQNSHSVRWSPHQLAGDSRCPIGIIGAYTSGVSAIGQAHGKAALQALEDAVGAWLPCTRSQTSESGGVGCGSGTARKKPENAGGQAGGAATAEEKPGRRVLNRPLAQA
ncbi:hypothetical protein L1887_56043 [Cichorium endivia]|nr:hypothetical protein L1887_56043 [Cichorium endivia]